MFTDESLHYNDRTPELKKIYEPTVLNKTLYSGGNVQWTSNGETMLFQTKTKINFFDVNTGCVMLDNFLGEEEKNQCDDDMAPFLDAVEDNISTFALSENDEVVVIAYTSGLIKLWDLKKKIIIRQWKGFHDGVIIAVNFSPDPDLLATGGSEAVIKIWNTESKVCLHEISSNLGCINLLRFYMKNGVPYLFASGESYAIKKWNLVDGSLENTLSGHFSTVTGIEIFQDSECLISSSTDGVVMLWNFDSGKQLAITPFFEPIRGIVALPTNMKLQMPEREIELIDGQTYFAVVKSGGGIDIFDVNNNMILYSHKSKIANAEENFVSQVLYNKHKQLFCLISVEHQIFIYNINDFSIKYQIAGYFDQIFDVVVLGEDYSYVAIATNSVNIIVYCVHTMSSVCLSGHTDVVVSLSGSPADPNVFASSSKDCTVRLWKLIDDTWKCVGLWKHNRVVSCVALSKMDLKFVATGGEDTFLTLCKIPEKFDSDNLELVSVRNVKAHTKDIVDISFSPNDKIVATCSMDNTANLWLTSTFKLLTTFTHKKAVNSVDFSPLDKVLVTASADNYIRLWDITSSTCLKVLEGHSFGVLRVLFISQGFQIVSCGGDGTLRIWNTKTGDNIFNSSSHSGKIWGLSVTREAEKIFTGGHDSKLVGWTDVTKIVDAKELAEKEKTLMDSLQFEIYMKTNDFINAFKVGLTLNRPATVLRLISCILKNDKCCLGDIIDQLDVEQKNTLFKMLVNWNTNSKSCYASQLIINHLLGDILSNKLEVSNDELATFLPYTEKHLKRLTQTLQDIQVLEYTLLKMNPISK